MIDAINKIMEDVKNRTRLMIGRCIIAAVKSSGSIQIAQVNLMADEVLDDVPIIQEYGFTSNPKPGAEAVAIFLGGQRDNGVIIATDDRRYRITSLVPGEVAIYTDEGDKIVLKRGNNIEVDTTTFTINASTKVLFNTPLVETTGEIKADLNITDSVATAPKSMAGMRTVYNTHTHGETGGTTNTPNTSM